MKTRFPGLIVTALIVLFFILVLIVGMSISSEPAGQPQNHHPNARPR
jgi:hypothetical protein